jgi:class 3 adenylate cyclase
MTAPDADHKPDEGAVTPEALAAGQRMLAAIFFTDTVGFSALMRKDEERALRLVARDLESMKTICASFGGQVLKSTGDGLMVLFTSAVQAVACALEIQRDFHAKNLELPQTEQLQHRIGIHLGDVFQQSGDVMGDGVNVAARLQSEAVPGGICLSKTVYDVVHNRLPFYVNDLGARKLKNIGTVTAYQISPIAEGMSRPVMHWSRFRSLLMKAAAVIALLMVLAAVFWLGMHQDWFSNHRNGAHAFAPLASPAVAPKATSVPKAEPVSSVATPTPKAFSGNIIEASEQEFEVARFDRMRNYDFEGMMEWIATHDWPGKASSHLSERCRDMQHLFRWTQERLHGYSATDPLVITDANGKKTAFWTVAFSGLKMKTDAQTITVMREQIPPAMMKRIVLELLAEKALLQAERAHFQGDLAVFSEAYNLQPLGHAPTP